jgi:hypothetical protein
VYVISSIIVLTAAFGGGWLIGLSPGRSVALASFGIVAGAAATVIARRSITEHVYDGRHAVNYSEFNRGTEGAGNTVEVVRNRSMPPASYTRFGRHPEAKLTPAELAELIAGLEATPGLSGGEGGGNG